MKKFCNTEELIISWWFFIFAAREAETVFMRNTIAICSLLFALVIAAGTHGAFAAGEFRYTTLHNAGFYNRVYDELNNPLNHALIRVTTDQEDVVSAVTSERGEAV